MKKFEELYNKIVTESQLTPDEIAAFKAENGTLSDAMAADAAQTDIGTLSDAMDADEEKFQEAVAEFADTIECGEG